MLGAKKSRTLYYQLADAEIAELKMSLCQNKIKGAPAVLEDVILFNRMFG